MQASIDNLVIFKWHCYPKSTIMRQIAQFIRYYTLKTIYDLMWHLNTIQGHRLETVNMCSFEHNLMYVTDIHIIMSYIASSDKALDRRSLGHGINHWIADHWVMG